MQIIPAIDIIDGQCVRLTQGDYTQQKVYNTDPLAVAQQFEDAGIKRLHLVDLDGARAGHIINYRVLETLARNTRLIIDFGGGLKSDEDVRVAFDSGAAQVTGGTIAVKDPARFRTWLREYGPERIILGADVRGQRVAVSGWQEESERELDEFLADYLQEGIRYTICTDVAKDGMLAGPALDLYRGIRERFPALQLIASGGVTTLEDLLQLRALGCHGAIVGKALYEGTIPLSALAELLE